MYLYFKGLQTLSEKRKYDYLHLLKYIKGLRFYIGLVALLWGLLDSSSCIFIDSFCANVGVTFQKSQTYSRPQDF